jgi:hypothetical protein
MRIWNDMVSLVTQIKKLFISFLFVLSTPSIGRAANPMNDFILSCSYGVLAGTLVGAASLAFTERPGDNLAMIARGASLGLYAGIILGTFVVYGDGPSADVGFESVLKRETPVVQLIPLFDEKTLAGAYLSARVIRF